MLAVIDYGVGNLFSLSASLEHLQIPHEVTCDPEKIASASHIILPGVGAFGDAAQKLFGSGMGEVVLAQAKKKPLLGICVGMQLLFEKSFEFGEHQGLGLLEGEVHPIGASMSAPLKVPHMGWNALDIRQHSGVLKDTVQGSHVYFVHSYGAKCPEEYITSTADYAMDIVATVEKGSIYGCQFHPEKSGDVGLSMLKTFYEIKGGV